MQLIEMGRPSVRAGRAALNFSPHTFSIRRDGNSITIPFRPGVEFYPLMEGEQFLLRWHRQLCQHCGKPPTQEFNLYFGGTDQRTTFLVELRSTAFRHFERGGESAFYEMLKPPVVRYLEERWGRDRTRRQGDIFAYSLPWGWNELAKRATGKRDKLFSITCRESTETLFDTRHRLSGYSGMVWAPTIDLDYLRLGSIKVGAGHVTAPDHDPLVLDGPHVLAQTDYLQNPRTAD